MKIAKALCLLVTGVLVVAMLVLIASVFKGVIVAGNLWLLLPLACYALAFFMLAKTCDSAGEVERINEEIRKLNKLEREMNEQFRDR